jgi:two-component system response regulator HydG
MRIFVIEDNPVYNDYVCNLLKKVGFSTVQAYRLNAAKKLLAGMEEDDIVLADLRLDEGESIDLLRWMRANGMRQPFIIMTNYGEIHSAVESMKLGSKDYIQKPLLEDKLIPLVRSLQKEWEKRKQRQVPIFVRQGAAYQNIKKRVRLVAATRMSVLILGENGTGKEHIAQHIHAQSKRADKPFVAVDCGSLSPTLAQSAFFGHVKGAFTGADTNRAGYFQEAEGGTLLLDEVGNLTMETQQMLLRAIQERRYRPIGAKEDKTADVRIVAATNEDLEKAVREKRFRQDLLYRLQEFVITVPPLRDSQEDILPLAEFFREIANQELERDIKGFDASARKALLTHAWPGNVRELKQKIQSAVLQAEGDMITEADLEFGSEPTASPVGFTLRSEEEEKERILRALKQAKGNKKLAAELLGISRATLYKKLKEYGMNEEN